MTRREEVTKINGVIGSLQKSGKVYSWNVLIHEYTLSESDGKDERYCLSWCDECKSFTCHYSASKACVKCQSRKSGLGNQSVHQKTIQTQMQNGTFNMLNHDVQMNKVSNGNVRFDITVEFCGKCQKFMKHRKWVNGKIQCCTCLAQNNGIKVYFCHACEQITLHDGSVCLKCHPEAHSKMCVKFCDECQKETLHNGSICGLCNPSSVPENFVMNFVDQNGSLLYYDRKSSRYVKWDEYKAEFTKNLVSIDDFEPKYLFPTFITRDDPENCGHMAFDQYLIDRGVKWFAYVKFYVDTDGAVKPLVAGKSGSFLVNDYGSDLSFSRSANDGPARRFLQDNDFDWFYEYVALYPHETEQDALQMESELKEKYGGLFSS